MTVFKGCLAHSLGFSGDAVVKNQPANAGDAEDAFPVSAPKPKSTGRRHASEQMF